MGAISKNGYTFDVEYSVMLQKAAVHVYKNGEFIREMPFEFHGQDPAPEQIEEVVNSFFINNAEGQKALLNNPLLAIYPHLKLFERKIIAAIAKRVSIGDANTKAYVMHMIDFELDVLNPSDITERLRWLSRKTIDVTLDGDLVKVPLLTDVRYNDRYKSVTFTFNSLLKPYFIELKHDQRNPS